MTEGQYSTLRLGLAKLVSSLLCSDHLGQACFEFASVWKQKYTAWLFPWKWSVRRNPNQERINHNAQIYLKTTLPNNNSDYCSEGNHKKKHHVIYIISLIVRSDGSPRCWQSHFHRDAMTHLEQLVSVKQSRLICLLKFNKEGMI